MVCLRSYFKIIAYVIEQEAFLLHNKFMLDILCIGDSVIDIFLKIPQTDSKVRLDRQNNKLLINYGDKIIIEKYIIGIGGNATNTAVGASRLGLSSGLCVEIGNDGFSQKIISTLKQEGVNTKNVKQDNDNQTSIAVALSFSGDRTLFTEHVQRKHEFNFETEETKLIYLTSLGHVWEKAYEKVREFTKKTEVLLAFNPGSLQLENKNKYVLDVIEETDYLFVNKQEAEEILYGKELGLEAENNKNLIKKLLFGLRSLGAKNVIITDSGNGSYLQTQGNIIYHLGIIKVEVVEKTGAGDAYTAGFLSAILKNLTLKEAMIWGAINSASVIQEIGAQDGLINQGKLNEIKNSLTNFIPEAL
jgi:sugar/nucleoside kinase (ribokinase family)